MAEKIDLGELELTITANTKGLKSVGGTVRALRSNMQSQLAAIVTSMKAMEDGMKRIASTTAKSSASVTRSQTNTKAALARTEKALFSVGQKYRDLSVATRTSNTTDAQKRTALGQLDAAYNRVVAGINRANGDVNKLNNTMRKFTGTTKNVTRVQKEWGAQLKKVQAKKTADDIKKLGISTTDLSKAVQVALGPLSGVASRITAISALANQNTLAIAGMVGALIAFGALTAKAIKLSSDYEKQMRQLGNRVAIFGSEIGITTAELDAFAVSLGSRTLASAEGARQALVTLTGVIGITSVNLKEALEASQRLADAGFGNLRTSARRLTRILSDPVQAMESLRTMGVRLTLNQRELAKDMLAVGDIAGAQTIILDALRRAHQGVNGAIDTTAGAYDDLQEKAKIFFQQMGAQGGILEPVTDGLKALSKEIDRSMGPDAVGSVSNFAVVMKVTLSALVGVLKITLKWLDVLAIALLSLFAGAMTKTIILGITALVVQLGNLTTALKITGATASLTKFAGVLSKLGGFIPLVVGIGTAALFMFGVFDKGRNFKMLDELEERLINMKQLTNISVKENVKRVKELVDVSRKRAQFLRIQINEEQTLIDNLFDGVRAMDAGSKAARGLAVSMGVAKQKAYQLELDKINKLLDEFNIVGPAAAAIVKQLGGAGSNAGIHMATFGNALEVIAKATTDFTSASKSLRDFGTIAEALNILSNPTTNFNKYQELVQILNALSVGGATATDTLEEMALALSGGREAIKKMKGNTGKFQIIDKAGLIALDEANTKTKVFLALLKGGFLQTGATVVNMMSMLTKGREADAKGIDKQIRKQDKANQQLRDLNKVLNDIDKPMDKYIRAIDVINQLNTAQSRKTEAALLARNAITQEIVLTEKLNLANAETAALFQGGLASLTNYTNQAEIYSALLAANLIPRTSTLSNFMDQLKTKGANLAGIFIELTIASQNAAQQIEGMKAALEVTATPIEKLEDEIFKYAQGLDGSKESLDLFRAAQKEANDSFDGTREALKLVNISVGEFNDLMNNGLEGQREFAIQSEIYASLLEKKLIPDTATLANFTQHLAFADEARARSIMNNIRATRDQANATADYKNLLIEIREPFSIYLEELERLNALSAVNPQLSAQVAEGIEAIQEKLKQAHPELKAVTDAFDGVADAFADMAAQGEFTLDSFGKVIDRFVRQALADLTKLMIMEPLKKAFLSLMVSLGQNIIGGFSTSTGVSGTGASQFTSFAPTQDAAHGTAFLGGVRKLGKGGLLSQPTLFGSKSGTTLAGEAGTEAVLPLKRTSSGDLGVVAMTGGNGGGNVIVNVFNNSGSSASAQSTPNSGGGETIDIFIDKVVSGLVKDPRSRLSSSIARTTNVKQKTVGR